MSARRASRQVVMGVSPEVHATPVPVFDEDTLPAQPPDAADVAAGGGAAGVGPLMLSSDSSSGCKASDVASQDPREPHAADAAAGGVGVVRCSGTQSPVEEGRVAASHSAPSMDDDALERYANVGKVRSTKVTDGPVVGNEPEGGDPLPDGGFGVGDSLFLEPSLQPQLTKAASAGVFPDGIMDNARPSRAGLSGFGATFSERVSESLRRMRRDPLQSHTPSEWRRQVAPLVKEQVSKLMRNLAGKSSKSSITARRLQKISKRLTGTRRSKDGWIHSSDANLLFGGAILLNTFAIGVDVELADENGVSWPPMVVVESLFLLVFLLELVLRMRADGVLRVLTSRWGLFDCTVILLGCLDAWVLPSISTNSPMAGISILRMFRILRLFRAVKAIRQFQNLGSLVKIMGGSLKAMWWIVILLFMVVYISSVMCMMILRQQSIGRETNYLRDLLTRSLGWMIFSHGYLITNESYLLFFVDATKDLPFGALWSVYWMLCIVFMHFFICNMIVGIIVQRALAAVGETNMAFAKFASESEQFKQTLSGLFMACEIDQDDLIGQEEFDRLMEDEMMRLMLHAFDIKTNVPVKFLHRIFGLEAKERISFQEFYESCLRMCGSATNSRSLVLQLDVNGFKDRAVDHIHKLRNGLSGLKLLCSPDVGSTVVADGHAPPQSPRLPRSMKAGTDMARGGNTMQTSPPKTVGEGASPSGSTMASSTQQDEADVNLTRLLNTALERFGELELQQEKMLRDLAELRLAICGEKRSVAVRCNRGHVLQPLGTNSQPTGWAEYRHWACEGVPTASTPYDSSVGSHGCVHGAGGTPASHLTELHRFHCEQCRYDLCHECYKIRLRQRISDGGPERAFKRPTNLEL